MSKPSSNQDLRDPSEIKIVPLVSAEKTRRWPFPLYLTIPVKAALLHALLSLISVGVVSAVYFLRRSSETAIILVLLTVLLTSITVGWFFQRKVCQLEQLTKMAQHIAEGRLDVSVPELSKDELGVLSHSFNRMASRLRETLENLDVRVQERTFELADVTEQMKTRAAQLQTVSDIARSIASIQDLDQLLPLIAQTISERLGFYHVGIFLVDANREYAVLRAANSEGGKRMLERGHRLKIGEVGIVGYVTDRGEPRIARDVEQDAVYFNNPDLHQTKSEMALPLIVRDQVIGALDLQSTEAGAFKEEDIVVFSILADQVAIAIENSRLFSATRQALEAAQIAQREFIKEEWSRVIEQRKMGGYVYSYGKLIPISPELKQELSLKTSPDSVSLNRYGADQAEGQSSELSVPISLRGQMIGMLRLQDVEEGHEWTEEEVSLVQAVADQVGLALENARLLETTRRRAEREFLVGQITTRLRASNDPEAILQTAVSELTKALRLQKGKVVIQPILESKPVKKDGSESPSLPDSALPAGVQTVPEE